MTRTEALKLCARNSAHYGPELVTYELAGPRQVALRQEIYSALTGQKQTFADSGVCAIEKELFRQLKPAPGGCAAADEENLAKAILELVD